ncbi:hypothetical protein T069G_00582 [Trichoderma breve]|uniref:Uncharacterized protein n=1 Tax=Trichoderma breve TaxID=2034170 RepID=A0A9W9ECF9_9HYPO|nr:hypothetical protein T069G_00582 [Trichoderma breve]KAJ4864052.1 hypothetical protein T069G_00582 [Trichoderma breve]
MSFDESFLSPRGLLVNNNSNFVCDGPNFSKLQQATQATLRLPYDDQRIRYVAGFTDKGMQELYSDLLIPIMEDFYKKGYRSVGDVCKLILKLATAAQMDYDKIFDALERLYGHESDNDSLREEVQAKIKERIDKLTSLSDIATNVTHSLRDAIGNVTEAQILVKKIGVDLSSQSTIERLRACHEGERDSEDFDNDCNALGILQGIIDKQNMQDDSGGSMDNLQHAVGATVDIWNDLTALSTYVAEHTQPGPGPLLDLQKNKLLEMWSDLATEVQYFLDNYME